MKPSAESGVKRRKTEPAESRTETKSDVASTTADGMPDESSVPSTPTVLSESEDDEVAQEQQAEIEAERLASRGIEAMSAGELRAVVR